MKPTVRILMVEDSDADARLLLCELARADFEIAAVRVDTAEALQQALTEGCWDLVCCDFTMPRFNGKAALQIVKQSAPDLPFIFVSGTIGEEVAVAVVKSGADDYVMKHDLARLASAVERELRAADRRRECQRLEADRRRLLDELQAALAEVCHLHALQTDPGSSRLLAGGRALHPETFRGTLQLQSLSGMSRPHLRGCRGRRPVEGINYENAPACLAD